MSQSRGQPVLRSIEFYHGSRPERIVWTPSERAPISGGQSARSAIPTSTPTTEVTTLPSTTTTTGITTLLTIGDIAARQLFLRLTFRPLARLAQNEEPAQPERIGGIVMFAMGKREQIERADRIKSGWPPPFSRVVVGAQDITGSRGWACRSQRARASPPTNARQPPRLRDISGMP